MNQIERNEAYKLANANARKFCSFNGCLGNPVLAGDRCSIHPMPKVLLKKGKVKK